MAKPLSPRERDIYILLAKGKSIAEIADTLELSVNTVKTHIKRIYFKYGMHKQVDLMMQALKQQGCNCLEKLK